MFTVEAEQIDTIICNVDNEKARDSLYQMLINYEIYKSTEEVLEENMKN